MATDLVALQREHEILQIDEGVKRYYRIMESQPASIQTPEQNLIRGVLPGLSKEIKKNADAFAKGKALLNSNKWGWVFLALKADTLALLTVVTVVNCLRKNDDTIAMLGRSVGNRAKHEYDLAKLKETDVDLLNRLKRGSKKWDEKAWRRAKRGNKKLNTHWPTSSIFHVGCKLLECLVISNPDVFEHVYRRGNNSYPVGAIKFNPEIQLSLEKQHQQFEFLHPWYMPMISKPLEITDTQGTGYYIHKMPLIKPNIHDAIGKTKVSSDVLKACDSILQVPYQINPFVYETMKHLWFKEDGNCAGLPYADLVPLPPKPTDIDTNEDALSEWKSKAHAVYSENATQSGRRESLKTILDVAARYNKYEKIWFPPQLDWRGRLYPAPIGLHYQASDYGKGLIQFAEAKPLNKEGYRQLRIHLANCFGVDKVSFADRLAFVDEHYDTLVKCGRSPLANRFWMEADDPFMALAACNELYHCETEGYQGFPSQLICRIDGSCNGLQHFSAMGRDYAGGRSVNLVPTMVPQDIYRLVAEQAIKLIGPDMSTYREDNSHPCHYWHTRIDRSVCKQPTMTTPYGVTPSGIRSQLIDGGFISSLDGRFQPSELATYMAKKIREATKEVIVSSNEIMGWLQRCAELIAEYNQPVVWNTPIGLSCTQAYHKRRRQYVKSLIQTVYFYDIDENGEIIASEQARSFAPNFVHSYDATHLFKTVNAFSGQLSPVHDSFGTHANDVKSLHRATREQFVDLYRTNCPMTSLQETTYDLTHISLPEPPKRGTLNIEDVLNSLFFFH